MSKKTSIEVMSIVKVLVVVGVLWVVFQAGVDSERGRRLNIARDKSFSDIRAFQEVALEDGKRGLVELVGVKFIRAINNF